jgi:hypothetical protein
VGSFAVFSLQIDGLGVRQTPKAVGTRSVR